MVNFVTASAPLRIDLAGGWTDVAPFPSDFGGEVVNFAINKRVVVRRDVKSTDYPPEFDFPVPRGSGLGTSSAMYVAISALSSTKETSGPRIIAEESYKMEYQSGNLCGRQDQWASALGGFNHLLFLGDSVEEMPFEPAKSAKNWLKKHLIISFSGISRNSGEMQRSVWESYSRGESKTLEGLHRIRGAVKPMANGLQQDRRDMVVTSLGEICKGVDLINPEIHDPFRSVIYPLIDNGSVAAWKALGAGGGGCSAILCSPFGLNTANKALRNAGWKIIDWDFEDVGVVLEK